MSNNYQDIINKRRIIGGEPSDLMAISPMKHAWARYYWKQMNANTWFPEEVDLSREKLSYGKDLTDGERTMYDKALAFLSNLDGFQFNNLMNNISSHVTSPEVTMVLSRQAFEEANHVDSYATIIETVSLDPMAVYMTFERDGILADKNEYIQRQSKILKDGFSPRNFALAVVANVILEGVYFYSGFLSFYTLAKRGKMLGTADMIKFIQRDEVVHMHFFAEIHKTLMQENPEVYDESFWRDAETLFREAVELETKWGQYIISGGVLGLSDQIISDYIKHLANDRFALLGRPALYPGVKNPVEWVDDFARINKDEQNFFEGKNKSYQMGSSLSW